VLGRQQRAFFLPQVANGSTGFGGGSHERELAAVIVPPRATYGGDRAAVAAEEWAASGESTALQRHHFSFF
jgi:hypothetical protein